MLIKLVITSIIYLVTLGAYATDIYIVKVGDTLSHIVEKHTPPPPSLYGNEGRLKLVISLNPHIKNPDLIRVGEKVYLTNRNHQIKLTQNETSNVVEDLSFISVKGRKPQMEDFSTDSWKVSADYTAKYLSYEQTGVFGKGDVGVLVFNNLRLASSYKINKYSAHLELNTFKLKYSSKNEIKSERFNSFSLLGGYKGFRTGLMISESPIFKNENSNVFLSQLLDLDLVVGYSKSWLLPILKRSELTWNTYFSYGLSTKTNNSDITVDSSTSYEAKSSIDLTRVIVNKKDFNLSLRLPVGLRYRNVSSNLKWGTFSGATESTLLDFSTGLGLEISF